jgi:uncharacterized protein (DUF302 family)
MKTTDIDREIRRGGRDATKTAFAEATLRYKPSTVRILFIAEAPPAFRFNRLFYFEDLRDGDTLFLEMMKTLYGSEVGFTENGFSPGSSAEGIRSRKSELLARFMREGCFLIDASEEPMPDRASSSQKLALLRASVPRLIVRLKEFAIDKNTPIVLIGGVTYSACAQSLLTPGFNVINEAMIDHPARGGQLRFRQKLRCTLLSGLALGLATCAMSGQTTTRKGEAKPMSIREVQVQRVSVVTTKPFDTVVARIDKQIGHPDMAAFRKSFSAAQNEAEMKKVVDPVTRPNGIMEFMRFDLGEVLRKESGAGTPRILRIVAGNPLIMKEMVKHVPDAGSYAPVTILIEERPDSVRISYDRMASYLASYGNDEALAVARDLDAKIERILTEAAK